MTIRWSSVAQSLILLTLAVSLTSCSLLMGLTNIAYVDDAHGRANTLSRNLFVADLGKTKRINLHNQSDWSARICTEVADSVKDLQWKFFKPLPPPPAFMKSEGNQTPAYYMSVFSFIPNSTVEIHSVGGRRVRLYPSVALLPLTAGEQSRVTNDASRTADVKVDPVHALAVLAILRTAFPEQASDLDDRQNLQAEFYPAYNIDNSLGEECWVVYNKKTHREFLYMDSKPEYFVPDGKYFDASEIRAWDR